jgi:hypothetical protein
MAIISTYPTVNPKINDLIIGTQVYTSVNPVLGNPTKSFTVGSIVELVNNSVPGSVSKITAGQGVTVSPSSGNGNVTISVPTAPQWLTSDAIVTNGVVNYESNLTIPIGSTSVGYQAFINMNINSIDFNQQAITNIGAQAFSENKLKGTLTLPSTLLTIEDLAFQNISPTTNKIELIEFGNQLTSIGGWAFYKNAITSLSIPSSVTTIGNYAFSDQQDSLNNKTLTSLIFEPRTTPLTISRSAFEYNGITSLSIPASTTVGDNSFRYSSAISSVTIGDNSTIGGYSFFNNGNISSLTIGDNVNFNGYGAFSCSSDISNVLTSVNIPSTTTFLNSESTAPSSTFSGRENLTAFTVANGVNSFWPQTINSGVVPDYIFSSCGLTEVSIDSNVTVGDSAFRVNPLTSISIGENVTIDSYAFSLYSAVINTLTIPGTTILSSISRDQFSGTVGGGTGSIASLIIEEGITLIPTNFVRNAGINSLTLPSSIVLIYDSAFRFNNISGTLTFSSVITINNNAFQGNSGITTVNVPIGSTISNTAFDSGVTVNYV